MEKSYSGDLEYQKFMAWFKKNHPDLYDKYQCNFSIPLTEGGGVSVNNSYKISQDEFDELTKVASKYYHPED